MVRQEVGARINRDMDGLYIRLKQDLHPLVDKELKRHEKYMNGYERFKAKLICYGIINRLIGYVVAKVPDDDQIKDTVRSAFSREVQGQMASGVADLHKD